ncbi:MAG: ABC transporter permease [Saccharofermentans sp.]|nr:ABC transporter permease [Saccharofermentans sp.]
MRRGTRAIVKSFFNFKGKAGTEASDTTFLVSVMFVIGYMCVLFSWVTMWFPYSIFSDEVYNIVVVNAPESFVEYNDITQADRDAKAEAFGSLTDYFANWRHITFFRYNYDGYGHAKFIYKDNPALYDFVSFSDYMRDNDAYLTVVFPEDFDEKINARYGELEVNAASPIVLTYYRLNSVEYTDMKEEFVDTYLGGYQDYLRSSFDIRVATTDDSTIEDIPVATEEREYGAIAVMKTLARSFVPLLMFILILYAGMSSGTNVIAGQKERGTFAGILMSPMPRSSIILGNTIGVSLKAAIPGLVVMVLTLLIPVFFSVEGAIAALIMVFTLAFFVASITLLISVISDTIVSAQTAFLPIFLILVAACVTCIQNYDEASEIYFFMPVYGQFYGLGYAFTGATYWPGVIVSCIVTILLAILIMFISSKLLTKDRFAVSVDTVTAKEIKLASQSRHSFMEKADIVTNKIAFAIGLVIYPLAVLSVYQLLAMIPVAIRYMRDAAYSDYILNLQNVSTITDIAKSTMDIIGIFLNNPMFLACMTVGYVLIILTYIARVRVRKTKSIKQAFEYIGLPAKGFGSRYIRGILLGFLMMGSVFCILLITGQIRITGFGVAKAILGTFFINLLMWLPQGASEEVMFRGFMIKETKPVFGTAAGVIISSVLFAAFHSLNVGFTPLAAINLFLIAFLFAEIYLLTGDIIITCGIHTMWNLCQGNVFGLQVSGTEQGASLIHVTYLDKARDIITGGAFGPEGGLAVTAVTVVALVIVTVLLIRKKKEA